MRYMHAYARVQVDEAGQKLVSLTVASVKPGSMLASRGIEHVAYKGVITLVEGYNPPQSCSHHMLNDLPKVLHSPRGTLANKMHFIVRDCECMAEDRLQRLPEGATRLPLDEAVAVVSYTYDLGFNSEEDGADNLFVALNETLRKRDPGAMQLLKPYLTYLMRGLRALPAVKTTCYRGIPPENLDLVRANYTQGSKVHWSAFTSCTLELDTAKRFAKQCEGIIFRIKILTARDVRDYSAFQDQEQEVLLSPNVRLVVTADCALDPDGYYYVDLVEMHENKGFVF
jgi:hypothetical protein